MIGSSSVYSIYGKLFLFCPRVEKAGVFRGLFKDKDVCPVVKVTPV